MLEKGQKVRLKSDLRKYREESWYGDLEVMDVNVDGIKGFILVSNGKEDLYEHEDFVERVDDTSNEET
ncbi:MAG: hypothetical protein R3A44_25960 [Caldilineaceae bacterium]